MPKGSVLILSYYFPPTPTVGGVRMAGLAKLLPSFGWHPTIITPHNTERTEDSIPIVETEDRDLARTVKRLLGLSTDSSLKDTMTAGSGPPLTRHRTMTRLIETVKSVVAIPDTNRQWSGVASKAAAALLSTQQFDAVITSSPPPSVHLAGARLSRTGLPWLADLRDPWWDDHNSIAPAWRRRLDRKIEIRTLRHAKALVTVSEPLAEGLRRTHKSTPTHTILNGYDPDLLNPGAPTSSDFTITHTGGFLQGRRDPNLLFSSLRSLLASGVVPRERLRVCLFARHENWLATTAKEFGIDDVIKLLPWASRDEVIAAQRRAQVLLLIQPEGQQEVPVYTGKIFEYLAAKRPILMLGGEPGVLSELILSTGAGVHIRTENAFQAQLKSWWEEFDATGKVAWRGNPAAIEPYSQLRMARQFAKVLDSIVSR
ncbi:MAG: glycosyltransferase family 4 protein [bacterium]|nr:glycosyltransferase family 4 protein [bacterium]